AMAQRGQRRHELTAGQTESLVPVHQYVEVDRIEIATRAVAEPRDIPWVDRLCDPLAVRAAVPFGPAAGPGLRERTKPFVTRARDVLDGRISDAEESRPGHVVSRADAL